MDEAFSYDAFGNLFEDTPDPFGYCGEYYDSETGLVYLRNRYYDTNIGRFITEDPIKDGLNWYAYCAGNPAALIDPFGLAPTISGEGAVQLLLNGYDIDTTKTQSDYRDPAHYSINTNSITIYLDDHQVKDDSAPDGYRWEATTLQFNILEDFPHVCQDVYIGRSDTCWAASGAECLSFLGIQDVDQKHIAESYYYDKVPMEEHIGEYYNRGVGDASKVAEAINKSGYLDGSDYIAVAREEGLNGMTEVIDIIEDNLPFIGFPRDDHIEAAIGYIYAPDCGVEFIICEDSSQKAESRYPREIFDVSRIAPKPVTTFQRR